MLRAIIVYLYHRYASLILSLSRWYRSDGDEFTSYLFDTSAEQQTKPLFSLELDDAS